MSAGKRKKAVAASGAVALGVVALTAGTEASLPVSGTVPKLIAGTGVGLAVAFAALVIVALGLMLLGADLLRTAGTEEEGTREQS